MPNNYIGNPAGISARQVPVIACPVDADAMSANLFNVPYQKIADYAAYLQAKAALLDQLNTFTQKQSLNAGMDAGGSVCTGFADPVAAQDAATRHFVDTRAGVVSSDSCGNATLTGSFVRIANLTVSLPTHGRPVCVQVQPGGGIGAYGSVQFAAGTATVARFILQRDGSAFGQWEVPAPSAGMSLPVPIAPFVDPATSDAVHQYELLGMVVGGVGTCTLNNLFLLAYLL